MTLKDIQTRIDQLVAQAQTTLNNARSTQYSGGLALVYGEWAGLRAASLSFIESTFGRDHSYYSEFDKGVRDSHISSGEHAFGVLTAIRDQIKGGWIETTKGLVTAEVFADFLEMAGHLLDQQYKDPAAVLVGGVLEEHLRQLCGSAGVDVADPSTLTPRKADSLNADLAKAGKYDKGDQKQITAWLDLRNRAAHGKYSEYTKEQVVLMLDGVRNFLLRVRP
jgi:hypothetical protein